MAVVISIGDWRGMKKPDDGNENFLKRLENSFWKAEMHRVEVSRIDHPGKQDEKAIKLLFIWAALFNCLSAYWFVKYVIN